MKLKETAESLNHTHYSSKEIASIIRGYRMLDGQGRLSSLLKTISRCGQCSEDYPRRKDRPFNFLVRPLPLKKLAVKEQVEKYHIRLKRDDTFLRNLLQARAKPQCVTRTIGSAKFAVSLNPWLDRCMLHRKFRKTKLMIIGIDYKHFPVFHRTKKDHNFPLDSYTKKNNIWGPTWTKFWKRLIQEGYSDQAVNEFIGKHGVFMTNSMLCFGGSENPQSHYYGYLKSCRPHIRQMIKIVKPEVIISFGDLGCRNVASLLLVENEEEPALQNLSASRAPLKEMGSIVRKREYKQGIHVNFASRHVVYWPVYQPARSHINNYEGDYTVLRKIIGL